jgi:hypothetical protein
MIGSASIEWIPGWTESIINRDVELAEAVCAQLKCPHSKRVTVLHLKKLHDYPRAVRQICRECGYDVFVKRYGEDADVSETTREVRRDIEHSNLQLMWHMGVFCNRYSGPHLHGVVSFPHFAIIEEFVYGEELLFLLRDVAQRRRSDVGLYKALQVVAEFSAKLHEAKLNLLDADTVQSSMTVSHSADLENDLQSVDKYLKISNSLRALNSAWMSDVKFQDIASQVALLHGGMTCVNLLFSSQDDLKMIDFETVGVGTRFFDVGCVTAELKTAFELYCGDSYQAEPYISFFLQEYYRFTRIGITYAEFTWMQAYFMGRRLLLMCGGRTFDDRMKKWLGQSALDGHLMATVKLLAFFPSDETSLSVVIVCCEVHAPTSMSASSPSRVLRLNKEREVAIATGNSCHIPEVFAVACGVCGDLSRFTVCPVDLDLSAAPQLSR